MTTSVAGLRADASRFLRRFGLVAAAWTTLLAAFAPAPGRPEVLWVGVAVLWVWAIVSQGLPPRMWWTGWLVAGVFAELLGPLAATGRWSVAGGAAFVPIAGAALTGRWRTIAGTVAVLALAALARGAVSDVHTLATSIGTLLVFSFGGLALGWLVRSVQDGQAERDALREEVARAQTARAVAVERAEASARLHDSVLQTLAAIGRSTDAEEARALARHASTQLRLWLREDSGRTTSLRRLLEQACHAVAGGRELTVAGAGDRPVGDRERLLVDAAAEAVRNAVRHTDGPVRVYAEITPAQATVWIADQGAGFVLADLPPERLGVRQSIVARMQRAGGRADVRSGLEGTEWALVLPPEDDLSG